MTAAAVDLRLKLGCESMLNVELSCNGPVRNGDSLRRDAAAPSDFWSS